MNWMIQFEEMARLEAQENKMKYKLSKEQETLYKRLEQSRKNGTGLMLHDPASVGILHQLITELMQEAESK